MSCDDDTLRMITSNDNSDSMMIHFDEDAIPIMIPCDDDDHNNSVLP